MESLAKRPPGPPRVPECYPPYILCACISAVVYFLFAMVDWRDQLRAERAGREWSMAVGHVIDFERRKAGRFESAYVVFIRYRAFDRVHVVETKPFSAEDFDAHFPRPQRNQTVEVAYSPEDPARAMWSPAQSVLIAKREKNESLLGGLISLAVGVGLVVGYMIEKRPNQQVEATQAAAPPDRLS